MAELRRMLEHYRVTSPMECHLPNMHEQDKMQNKWEMRDQIDSCLKDLGAPINHGESLTSNIISMLCDIKHLLTELPASKRAQIEKSFSRLCTDADTLMNTIMTSVKIQFDQKQSRLSFYFHELATKEMRASKNAASALKCMTQLGVILEREKANIETNIAHLDRVSTPMECHEQYKMQIAMREMTSQIDSWWEDLSAQIEDVKFKTWAIMTDLCDIEELLTVLPASKRAQIEASFSRLCTEADIVMNAIMNSMKIQSDEKQSRLSIYFHELAIAANPSF
ncbi:hypothetical protein Tco_1330034 [Tanacetum coccineum]